MATLSLPWLPAAFAALAPLVPGCGGGSPEGGSATASGPLRVDQPLFDFGPVFEGRLLEHAWEVRVAEPLAIQEAKTDCGCTLVHLELERAGALEAYEFGTPLAAGERLRVTARYDTRGRPGPAHRSVTLTTATGALFPLTFATEVRSWLQMEPGPLGFTRVLEGLGTRAAFQVSAAGGEAFGLHATSVALPPWVTVQVAPVEADGSGRARHWNVLAVLDASAPRGTYNYPLELVSDVEIPGTAAAGQPRSFSISPNWTLQILGPVALSSPNLEFGLVRADETVSKSVRLESFDPAFVPGEVNAHLEPLREGEALPLARTAQVRTRASGRVCDIELVLAGLDPEVSGNFLAKLVIETGHPALPRLEALVRGVRVSTPQARRP